MNSKIRYSLLMLLVLSTGGTVLAGEASETSPAVDPGQEETDLQLATEQPSEALPAVASSSPSVRPASSGTGLQTTKTAPFVDVAGMCDVVNGILGDFCVSNPQDPGCQALQQ